MKNLFNSFFADVSFFLNGELDEKKILEYVKKNPRSPMFKDAWLLGLV